MKATEKNLTEKQLKDIISEEFSYYADTKLIRDDQTKNTLIEVLSNRILKEFPNIQHTQPHKTCPLTLNHNFLGAD